MPIFAYWVLGASLLVVGGIIQTFVVVPELRVRGAALNPGSSRRRVVEARVILNWALPVL